MQPDETERRAAHEADLARRIRDAVVTEVPRRPVRAWLLTVSALLSAVTLLAVLVVLLVR